MTTGFILELSDSDKDPGFFGQTKFGVGPVAGSLGYTLLLVGMKATTGGSMTPDVDVVDITTNEDCDTYAGAGGQLARMGYAALRIPGIKIKMAAVTAPGGGTAATATITIGGTPTGTGQVTYRICGDAITVANVVTDTPTTYAARIAAAITAKTRFAASAANVAGLITLTLKTKGLYGNDAILVQDKTQIGAGLTSVIAGGTATANGGVRFTSGAGTEDVTALLAVLYPGRYHRIAIAQKDNTNLGKWETQIDSKAGPYENRTEHVILAYNDALQTAVTSAAQATLDNWRFEVLWGINIETLPCEMAAVFAAYRTSIEPGTPNVSYDDYILPGVFAQTADADKPTRATRVAALDAGITPIKSIGTNAMIVRAITTRSITATSDPDDRTIDVAESVVPDWVRDDLQLFWKTGFVIANPYVRDDFAPEEKAPKSGVAYPKFWTQEVTARLLKHQEARILTRVETNPVKSVFNKTAKRIASRVPTVVLPIQHQMECSIEQVPYATAP